MTQNFIRRGDIYLVSKQDRLTKKEKTIPVVVVSNNVGNTYAPVVLCASMSLGKRKSKTQAQITNCGKKAVVYCDQIDTVDKSRLMFRVGEVSSEDMDRIDDAIESSLDLNASVNNHYGMRGKIVFVDEQQKTGSEQHGGRPALIVSSEVVNGVSSAGYEVVYATTKHKNLLPTHVSCGKNAGFIRYSTLLCEQLTTVSRNCVEVIGEYTLPMDSVNKALKTALGLIELSS